MKVTETSKDTKRNIAAFLLKFGIVNRGLDEIVPIPCNVQGKELTNVVDISIEYDSFLLCYVPHHFLGSPWR